MDADRRVQILSARLLYNLVRQGLERFLHVLHPYRIPRVFEWVARTGSQCMGTRPFRQSSSVQGSLPGWVVGDRVPVVRRCCSGPLRPWRAVVVLRLALVPWRSRSTGQGAAYRLKWVWTAMVLVLSLRMRIARSRLRSCAVGVSSDLSLHHRGLDPRVGSCRVSIVPAACCRGAILITPHRGGSAPKCPGTPNLGKVARGRDNWMVSALGDGSGLFAVHRQDDSDHANRGPPVGRGGSWFSAGVVTARWGCCGGVRRGSR